VGGLFDGLEEYVQSIHDWAVWVAFALAWIVLVGTITAGFVIWGVLRIARLLEISAQPRNPPPPSSYGYQYGPASYGPRQP
jgi:hypothetical protein